MEENRELDELEQCDAEDEELANSFMLQLADQYRIRASSEYDRPEYTLSQNGIGFAPLGNIMALMAEKKNGKTFLNMTLAAALLKGEYLGVKGEVENATVIFFDTEQDLIDGQLIQRRVHYVCGWDFNTDNDRFRVFHLREIPFDQRRKFISWAIRYYRPTVAFVDGLRDLIKDFNDLTESADLIQEMMTVSSQCRCAIWQVLHVNPNSDKMRGHLGTELGNKVTDTFRVVKERDNGTKMVTFTVDHVDARHRDVDGWTFKINDDKPFGIPELLTAEDNATINQASEDRKSELRAIMSKYIHDPAAISKSRLRDSLKSGEAIGSTKAWKMIEEAISCDVLDVVIGGKLRIKHNNDIQPEQTEMPF